MEFNMSTLGEALRLLFSIMLILVAFGFIFAVGYLHYVHRLYSHIPGPPLDRAENYGPLYKIFLFHKCMLIPTSRIFLEEVLTKKKYRKAHVVYKRLYDTCGERFLGNGLVTCTDHKEWMKRRVAIEPAFHRKNLINIMQQFNDIADEWVEELHKMAITGETFSMSDLFYRVTLDLIGKVAFNMDIDSVKNRNNLVPTSLNKILEGFSAQLRDPLLRIKPGKRKLVKDVQEAVIHLRSKAKACIEDRIDFMQKGHSITEDILSLMIRNTAQNQQLGMEDLIDDFMTIFIAGQETTANTLAFLFNEIGRQPHIHSRLQEEVDHFIKDKQFISHEDTSKLQYMSQVWKETLRLYPPAPGTARENCEECIIDGWKIPKGSFITVSFFVNHRLQSNYSNPFVFDPERFAPCVPRPEMSFLPFSAGPRSCAGQNFAQIESKVLLAKFLQRFTFKLDPEQSFEVLETTTLRPAGGTMMKISLR